MTNMTNNKKLEICIKCQQQMEVKYCCPKVNYIGDGYCYDCFKKYCFKNFSPYWNAYSYDEKFKEYNPFPVEILKGCGLGNCKHTPEDLVEGKFAQLKSKCASCGYKNTRSNAENTPLKCENCGSSEKIEVSQVPKTNWPLIGGIALIAVGVISGLIYFFRSKKEPLN